MKTYIFEDTGDAYDASNASDKLSIGDVLVIPSERVVGLSDAWPVAVTAEFGKFHTFTGPDLSEYGRSAKLGEGAPVFTRAAIVEAVRRALDLGLSLAPYAEPMRAEAEALEAFRAPPVFTWGEEEGEA